MKSKKLVFKLALFTLLAVFLSSCQSGLKSAFNGKDFEGWVMPENNTWWSVDNGILSVQNGPEKKGNIIWTEKKYQDFVVVTDFLFGKGTVDSGIFLRTDKHQIQIGISASLKRDMTASPYIAGKGYPVEASGVKELLKQDDWNRMKVKVVGPQYTVWLNGKEVMTYVSENPPKSGPIGLQLHANKEMKISFKNIKIGEI